MADSKITDLPILTTPSNSDVLPIVDLATNTTKQIAVSSLGNSFTGNIAAVSGNWNSTFTNVNSNSGNWGVTGTGTEIQFKNGSVFGAVSGSSVDSVSGIVTFREIRANFLNPLKGPRIFEESNVSQIWFHGTTPSNAANPYLWSGAGSSIINARGSLFRVEGVNGSPSTATLAIGGATLRSPSSNVLTLGSVDANSPLPQTISVQSATSSANAAGSLFSIEGSQSTGSAVGGDIRFRTSRAGGAGSTTNALVENMRILGAGGVRINGIASASNFATLTLSGGGIVNRTLTFEQQGIEGVISSSNEGGYGIMRFRVSGATALLLNSQMNLVDIGSSFTLRSDTLSSTFGRFGGLRNYGATAPTEETLRLDNLTPATSAIAQTSPSLTLVGQGWNPSVSASSAISVRQFVIPDVTQSPIAYNYVFQGRAGNSEAWFNLLNIRRSLGQGNSLTFGGIILGGPSNQINAPDGFGAYNATFGNSTWGTRVNSNTVFMWTNNAVFDTPDLGIRRAGPNNLALGPLDANNAGGTASSMARFLSAQTISVQNAATGMANAAGSLFTIDGSRSTGNALGGDIRFRTADASTVPTNSATQNGLNEVFRIKGNRTVNFAALPSDPTGSAGGDVYYNSTFNSLELFNGTAFVPVNTTRTIATFTALENHPVSANFATLNTRNFDNVGVLQFAAGATIREARFISVIPDNAVLANGLLIRTQFSTITATSGSCRWGAQIKKLSSTSYAASAGIDVTVSGTANQTTMTGTITLPSIDSLAPGDAYALRIFRESSNVADTLVDSAQLLTVEVRTNI